MKKRTPIALLLLLTLCTSLFALYGCKEKREKFTAHSLELFDTVTTVTGYAESQEEFDRISEEILLKLRDYHRLYTIYHRFDGMENLCTVNELKDGAHRVVTVDRRIIDLLYYAREMYELTNGQINVAMGSVLSIWHEYRSAGMDEPFAAELPSMDKLKEASLHTDITKIVIDEDNSTVFLADPQMKLDVGAIAKGYAAEMVARDLEERGISGYILNVGGNVRTVGTKPNGEKWLTGIENPGGDDDSPYHVYLSVAGESVVTSGSYQRYYVVDGKSYHHIIDPDTLMPAEGYQSVSIVCRDSGMGDALSTAIFCMPFEEGLALIERVPDAEAMWVMGDGSKQFSSGFSSYVTERK